MAQRRPCSNTLITKRSVEAMIKTLATKEDLYTAITGVKDEIIVLRGEMSDMRKEGADTKSELMKWMFIFWIGQVAAMLAIVLIFIKK